MNFLRLARNISYNFFGRAICLRPQIIWFMAGIFLIILAVNFLIPPVKTNERDEKREKIQKEIVFWQKTEEDFPGYRDGYLKLAILNWKIYQNDEAQKFLNKALEIDPNNSIANSFARLLVP